MTMTTPGTSIALTGPTLAADITFTRASVGTYFDVAGALQDAAINAPRFTYDPATHEALGLLVEETRTNLVLNNATGVTSSVTVTAVAHTLSFVGTGSVALSGAFVGNLAGIGPGFGDRRTLTFTPAAGSLTLTVTGSVQWLQVEAGASATTIIKTTGAATTRSADNAVVTGAAFSAFWNQAQGTVQVEGRVPVFGASTTNALFAAGNPALAFGVRDVIVASFSGGNSGRPSTSFTLGGVTQANLLVPLFMTAGAPVNHVNSWAANSFNEYANSVAAPEDLLGTVPPTVGLSIGSLTQAWSGATNQLNSTIKSFRYWNTALTPAQLQALSSSSGGTRNGGLLYNNDGALVVADGGAIFGYVQGGLPVTSDGALCVAYGGAPVRFLAGIPFDAAWRVCLVAPVPPVELEAFDISFEDPAFG